MSTKLSFSCYSTFQYYASDNQFAWLDGGCLRYIRRDTWTLREICHQGFLLLFFLIQVLCFLKEYFIYIKLCWTTMTSQLQLMTTPLSLGTFKREFRLYRALLDAILCDITSSHHPHPTKITLWGNILYSLISKLWKKLV